MKAFLNFGGFHQSDHGLIVEEWVSPDWDNYQPIYDWDAAQNLYGKLYVDWFNSLFDTQLSLIQVWKPAEYNFQTESLLVRLPERDFNSLKLLVYDHYALEAEDHIRSVAAARAGYVPTCSEKSIQSEPDRFAEICLDVLLQQSSDDWWGYFDEHNLSEIANLHNFKLKGFENEL